MGVVQVEMQVGGLEVVMGRWDDGIPVHIRPVSDERGLRFLSGQLNFKMKSLLPLDFLLALSKCNSIA